jgi:molybdenum cofactor cytidylyltransferase
MSSIKARVAGVVLAAGPSSRFGDDLPKQLLELEGEPLVRRVARRALESNLIDVIVVVGYREREITAALGVLPLQVVVNPHFEQGQSTSVRVGLAEVRPDATAVMFLPVDQPHLTRRVIDRLIAAHEKTSASIVVPAFEGERGAPVLISAATAVGASSFRGMRTRSSKFSWPAESPCSTSTPPRTGNGCRETKLSKRSGRPPCRPTATVCGGPAS